MAEASYTPSRKPELIGPAASRAAHPFSAASAVAPLLRLRWAWSKYLDPALLAGGAANDTKGCAAATKIVFPNLFNQPSILGAAAATLGVAAATKMVLPNRFNQHSIFRR